VLVKLREGDRGTVFGRRRWRMPWSSGTSGEPWSPGPVRPTWAPKTTRSPWAEPPPPPGEPAVHLSGQRPGTPTTSEAPSEEPSEAPSRAVSTPTVKVIPPGVTASAGSGTAPGGTGAPGATPSAGRGGRPGATGSLESAGPPRARVIRIPASVGVEHPGDSASASSRAEPMPQRPPLALAEVEAPSVDEPLWEEVGSEGQRRIAPAVIAVVVVCALLGGLAALAATLGGTAANPHPASSIAPGGTTAPGGRPRPAVSRAASKHMGGQGHSGHGSATPLHATTRSVVRTPTATPASSGGAGRRAASRKHHQQPKRAVQPRHPVRNARRQ
jgi:hypothetical protein